MAKPNYSFEKRQRELARKKKQEEKRQRKATDKADKTIAPDESAPAADPKRPSQRRVGRLGNKLSVGHARLQ